MIHFFELQSTSRRKGNWNEEFQVAINTNVTDNCKAHPDEKGIETFPPTQIRLKRCDCKAHPDEKGIETKNSPKRHNSTGAIAKHIPTKRELKL